MGDQGYDDIVARRYDEDLQAIFGGWDRGDLDLFRAEAATEAGLICDVAAGTGRITLAMARATDARVVAVEPSAAMRRRFEAKLAEEAPEVARRTSMRAGHFCALPLEDASVSLVVCGFRGFQHLTTEAEQRGALREMWRVLVPGGRLVLDLFEPDPRSMGDAAEARVARYISASGSVVERFDSRTYERVAQLFTARFRWVERSREGDVIGEQTSSYQVRHTFRWEMTYLLELAGFAVLGVAGDYDGSAVSDEPRELIFTACRPR